MTCTIIDLKLSFESEELSSNPTELFMLFENSMLGALGIEEGDSL